MSAFIHTFLLATYSVGRLVAFLKQRSLAYLPMTNRGIFSVPVMLAHTMTVSLSFDFSPLLQSMPLKSLVSSGSSL